MADRNDSQGVSDQAVERNKIVEEVKNMLLRDEHFRHLPPFAKDYLLNQLGVLAMGFKGTPMQLEAYLQGAAEQIISTALAMQARNEDEEKIKKALSQTHDKWMNQQQAFQDMEKRLHPLQVEWGTILSDEQKLNARMRNKAPLDEEALRKMNLQELEKLEITERWDLAELVANIELLEEIHRKKKAVMLDTGRMVGLRGTDNDVLQAMAETADGKRKDVLLTPSQAEALRTYVREENHIAAQRAMVKLQEARVEKVLNEKDFRGVAYAPVAKVQEEGRKISRQYQMSDVHVAKALQVAERQSEEIALRKVEKVQADTEKARADAEKAKVETGKIEANEMQLLQMSQKMATILKIEVPIDIRSSGDYIPVFSKALSGQELSEVQQKRLLGLVEELTNHEKEKVMGNIARKEGGNLKNSGISTTPAHNPVGKFTQQLTDRSPKGNVWER